MNAETKVPLWKARVRVPAHETARTMALFELTPHPEPVAVLSHEVPGEDDITVEALYAEPADEAALTEIIGHAVQVAPLPDQDWIKLSYEGLPPVRAGRFFVYGAHDRGRVPGNVIPLAIDAGEAFGTGHHETTSGCLEAIADILRERHPRRVLDLGTGTGVLAIAIAKASGLRVLATDLDPRAVAVANANVIRNGAQGLVRCVTADGFAHEAVAQGKPWNFIVANILAGPLTRLAPAMRAHMAPGGQLVLSGLLRNQEAIVLGFYHGNGFRLRRRYRRGPWSTLWLTL
ncbi:MAG TPA: 50S ribosomal protein L11 methyltransferase [Micropepsaceae bacterium]|nr:50S ribosomal protein L11 methyltransferase [Micropepsaceae bacterium]